MGALSKAAFQALVTLVTEHTVYKDSCKPADAESVRHLIFWGISWLLGFGQPRFHMIFLPYLLNQLVFEVRGYFSKSEMHANDIGNKFKNNNKKIKQL